MTSRFANPVFVALDTPDLGQALAWGRALAPVAGGLKIGLEFVHAQGPKGIEAVVALGAPVFLDVKLHDIPNTVAGAVRTLAKLGVAIINVHASGGSAMMRAAQEAAAEAGAKAPEIIGVTMLTSLDDADLAAGGVADTSEAYVTRLAKLARDSGLAGVVCSAREIAAVRHATGKDFLITVPGIRPRGSDVADQKRVMSPDEAVAAGADIIVVGRPITKAADPASATRAITATLKAA